MIKKTALTLLALLCCLASMAYIERDLRRLTMADGLPDNMIHRIYRDARGFMWFATDQGIARYDGTTMRAHALPDRNQRARNIMGSSSDLLWVWGDGRLNCFDCNSESFMHIENHELITNNAIFTAKVYADSVLWLTASKLLIEARVIIDRASKSVSIKSVKRHDKLTQGRETLVSSIVSPTGDLYLATTNDDKLIIKPAQEEQFIIRKLNIRRTTKYYNSDIHHIDIIDNSLWICTMGAGVIRYRLDTGQYEQFGEQPTPAQAAAGYKALPHPTIFEVDKVDNSEYIISTWNGYVTLKFDANDQELIGMKSYANNASATHLSMESRIRTAYIDSTRVLWLGTSGGGVLVSNLLEQFYDQHHLGQANTICSMTEDKQGHIWLSTYHGGIMRSTQPFQPKQPIELRTLYDNTTSGVTQYPMCMTRDAQKQIFTAGTGGVIVEFDAKGNYTRHQLKVDGAPDFKKTIIAIFIDPSDRMWIGTPDELLEVYDRTHYRARAIKAFKTLVINNITDNQNGKLWIATSNGALIYDPSNGQISKHANGLFINTILAPDTTHIYIGTMGGLVTIENGVEKRYTTRDGLSNNNITCLIEGLSGEIWLGNLSGISRFSRRTKIFYNYYIQGNNQSCTRTDSGILLWGNNKSIAYFNPDVMSDYYRRLRSRPVVITDLEVGGQLVGVGDTINGQVILSQSLQLTNNITLTQENNNFALHVSNLMYSSSHQRYQYRLLPVQSEWIVSRQGERIAYAALPADNYTFQVRPMTTVADEAPITQIEIRIEEFWLYSWWAKIIYVLILVGCVAAVVARVRARYKRQVYISKLRNEINSQRAEIESERRINKERFDLFAYASHELRTPLTLVLSPMEEVLDSHQIEPPTRKKLQIAQQNASAMLDMVQDMLYAQKLDAKRVKLEVRQFDIVQCAKQVIDSLECIAVEQNATIKLKNATQKEGVLIYADEQKINSAISNLLSNSLKYRRTQVECRIEVTIDTRLIDGASHVVLTVADNGKGIAPEIQGRIFESFITDSKRPAFSSKIGMGLYIVRNIAQLHHGKIELHSQVDQGSQFTLFIPIDSLRSLQSTHTPSDATIEAAVEQKELPTILVVEDNEQMGEYIGSLFESEYRVLRAPDGKSGMAMAREHLPSIIIHDVMLPDISGLECCRILSQDQATSRIPIILLSANADQDAMIEGATLGAADFLSKPFNPQILRAKVSTLLRRAGILKQIYSKSLMLDTQKSPKEQSGDNLMQKVIGITEANLTDPDFGVEALAAKLGVSVSTLRRSIKSHTSLSITEVVRNVRLTKAASMLLEHDYRVGEVAEQVGYNDISTFRTQFTKKFGISPSQFHKSE